MNVPPKILIVEDQYFVAVDCELHVRAAGMECVGLATTAANALDLAQREKPDLIIMDIRLASRADGVEAAIVIYERLGIRCIFTSAHADELTHKDAERAKPLAWVDKPYLPEQLIAAIQRALDELQSDSSAGRIESSPTSQVLH